MYELLVRLATTRTTRTLPHLVPARLSLEMAPPKDVETLARRKWIARIICAGELFACCSNTPLISTRAPVVLSLLGNNASAAAKALGAMSSCSAAVELLAGPVLGRLSDTIGRRRLLLISPCLSAAIHTCVGLFPKLLW